MKNILRNLRKLGIKFTIIGAVSIVVLFSIFQIVLVISVVMGSGKDDMVLFHGDKYTISKLPNKYSLFEEDKGEILPNVKAYLVGKEKSYVRNQSILITIDETNGTYSEKYLTEITILEENIIKEMKTILQ
ncbi:MAG TPA: hypothetical protein IAA29_07435 [Candidatus Paenibacillus intestinavium]|nr:hypothetical protein [Candidatus Paenibacillus intestinavium]